MAEPQHPQNRVSDSPTTDDDAHVLGASQPVGSDAVALEQKTFRLDDDTRAFLRAEAARLEVSESEIVRQGLAFWRGWLAHERESAGPDSSAEK